ncbi:MAG: helix-turn-helix domain-containing protein [Desulfovibrio sp.]|jgi:hypothetical protein|nr:helix-turn-helix domain-containing protein [Desulfovibrio sp.]
MQPQNIFEDTITRLSVAAGAKNEADLAREIGVFPQAVTSARKRNRVPASWFAKIAEKSGTRLEWLMYGKGPMREQPVPERPGRSSCENCLNLYKQLVEAQNREIALLKDVASLKTENAELKAENLRLRERG